MQDLTQAGSQARGPWPDEQVLRSALFDDLTMIHENDAIGQSPGKLHLVSDADQGERPVGETQDSVQDFLGPARYRAAPRARRTTCPTPVSLTSVRAADLLMTLGPACRYLRWRRNCADHPLTVRRNGTRNWSFARRGSTSNDRMRCAKF